MAVFIMKDANILERRKLYTEHHLDLTINLLNLLASPPPAPLNIQYRDI